MLNAPKPVHINLSLDSTASDGDAFEIYTYEDVPDGTVALRVTVPGMGAGQAPATGLRSPGRKASWIWLRNMDGANDVAVSFDNGNNFITIKNAIAASNTYDTFSADIAFRHFYIKALANTADVQCIVGINGPN